MRKFRFPGFLYLEKKESQSRPFFMQFIFFLYYRLLQEVQPRRENNGM